MRIEKTFKRQGCSTGSYAKVVLDIEESDHFSFENRTNLMWLYVEAVQERMTYWLGRCPVKVVLVDGRYHHVDSNQGAFVRAAGEAALDYLRYLDRKNNGQT